MGNSFTPAQDIEVTINVYSLTESNSWLGALGVGAYHTGVVIGSNEYSFSDRGVNRTKPRLECFGTFKETIMCGTVANMSLVNEAVTRFRDNEFRNNTYDIANKNCNHFTKALVRELCAFDLPAWINRAANIGSIVAPKRDVGPPPGTTLAQIGKVSSPPPAAPSLAPPALSPAPASKSFSWFGSSTSSTTSASVAAPVAAPAPVTTGKREITAKQKALLGKLKTKT